MSRTIILIPISTGVGLTSVSLGLVHSLEQKGAKVGFLKPIAQPISGEDTLDRSTTIIRLSQSTETGTPFMLSEAETLIAKNQTDVLLEKVVERHQKLAKTSDIIVIEGLIPTRKNSYANSINYEIAQALDAEIVLVAAPAADKPAQLKERIDAAVSLFGGRHNPNLLGVVINKFNAPVDESGRTRPDLTEIFDSFQHSSNNILEMENLFKAGPIKLLACIAWKSDLIATRAIDVVKHLGAAIINEGEVHKRRIRSVTFCARSLPHMVDHFKAGSLLVASADRPDVIVAASLAAMNGVEIGALLLTGGYKIDTQITKLCQQAFETGLPIFRIEGNTWQTALSLQSFSLEVPVDDKERIDAIKQYVSEQFDAGFIDGISKGAVRARRLSPAAFRYQLTELAREAKKRIVLPEGDEPRTVKAATLCAERGIAECVLLAPPADVQRVAEAQGVTLGKGITIIDPAEVRENYVARLVELRKNKGMTEVVAREQLLDTVVLGTMMLEANEVDGLVSGAVHTTANTIRPPMQIIKTAPGNSIISSVFFMLLPDQVLVYGDCAVNPDPTPEQLAEIAIQSAESAKSFGIDPRVAMISYSTGTSGAGADVEKVAEATRIAKEKRPDLIIDGPLQYDAAIMEDVARSKAAPNSPVAGKATVFVFPDLNTGNTTYKAVQRSADLVSIGPMLQGMRKPVNDLSRGALVDDIVYTIALTAIQATQ
ncbi:phosphate acetyltransferase [Glaesserella parasuis]|nr:phosphate acetyltransferase [Glaesserella parasuis]